MTIDTDQLYANEPGFIRMTMILNSKELVRYWKKEIKEIYKSTNDGSEEYYRLVRTRKTIASRFMQDPNVVAIIGGKNYWDNYRKLEDVAGYMIGEFLLKKVAC